MNEQEKGNSTRPRERIRFSSIISFTFLSVVAIIIAYILGVMVGRNENGTKSQTVDFLKEPSKLVEKENPKKEDYAILKPQELDYALVLRNEKARTRPAAEVPSPSAGTARPETNPVVETPAQTPENNQQERQDTAKIQVSPQEAMWDYVFQLGAFKDEDTVDALRQKLEGRGLRTRMKKDGNLYLVMVLLRGGQERANEVNDAAKALRLGEPIVISRKPVGQ